MTSDDPHFIGYAITDVGRLLRTVFERRVRTFGLTRAQWMIITRLHRRPGLSQSEIADLLEIEKAPAGRLIERMEAKGWLLRRDDSRDKRINRLYLTARGHRLHAAIWPIAEATVDAALGDLSADERRRLTGLMLRVKSKLQALAERDPLMQEDESDDQEAQAP
jgi:DNA-binding MarR family transcriptional regulator